MTEQTPEEIQRLLHELQVHQTELEMQNQELRETQERLHASERRYYDLFRLAPVGYLSLDLHGRILELNQAAARLLKAKSIRTVLQTPFLLFVHTDSRETYSDHLRQISESGRRQACELILVGRDGSETPVRLESAPAQDEDRITGLRSALIDMTEQRNFRRLETAHQLLNRKTAELRELTRQLISAEHRERERLAQVLHDHVQQLLVAAKLRLCSVRSSQDEDAIREVDRLIDQSIALSRSLVADLAPPVLLQAHLADTVRWLARRTKETYGLDVEVQAPDAIDAASQEERLLLFEIIRELLINITKHAGTSRASVAVAADGPDGIRVQVSDEGAGFDPETAARDDKAGFGILSIKHRLSWMGGQMKIHSAPGKGCRVEILFPSRARSEVSKDSEPSLIPSGTSPPHRDSSGRIRVLIADDHKILRQGLSAIIKAEPDLELVGEAKDGGEAIELTRSLNPDVVIMDIEMPGTNGIDATRAIVRERPEMRVIGLSMHTREDVEQSMRSAGACEYFPKDAPAENLLSAIRRQASTNPVRG